MTLAALRSPATIRSRCANILAAVVQGHSPHWQVDRARLDGAAAEVEHATRSRYPTLEIPYHSRWRHFEAGGVDRAAALREKLMNETLRERRCALIDLAVVSVLLDAGAGAKWSYLERETGQRLTRSEGLGVASLRAFFAGAFSSEDARPWRVDARALLDVDAAKLARVFQVRDDNPLVGLEGRAALLQRLGRAMADDPARFGAPGRPGAMFDALAGESIEAAQILATVLDALSPIWLTGATFDGAPLGDAWRHPWAGGEGPSAGWVPFHKLSQWLAYSLFEPFEWTGTSVQGRDALTALPEYRNGGLLLDCGVIRARNPLLLTRRFTPGDEAIVEWRALTVALIDELAPLLRERLGLDAQRLPLACVLEGGTWAAGRATAQRLRRGLPPLAIDSDGTVF